MNLTVYVPKDLEEPLRKKAREMRMTAARLVQRVLRESLGADQRPFSRRFRLLAGSWEGSRGAEEVIADIEASRRSPSRAKLR